MALLSSRLPSRFPVGTKLIVEGRAARDGKAPAVSRFLEFPDGTSFSLPSRALQRPTKAGRRLKARSKLRRGR
jgi:hypothetical protein